MHENIKYWQGRKDDIRVVVDALKKVRNIGRDEFKELVTMISFNFQDLNGNILECRSFFRGT